MAGQFVNRKEELSLLDREIERSKVIVLYGRRRTGKTRLLTHWGQKHPLAYSQAIEGSEQLQIEQLHNDLKEHLPAEITPRSWTEFFEILALIKKKIIIAIDEFPYLVETNPSLPSIMQKWIDHKQPQNVKLILLGSSQTMMHGTFLHATSPLFERADRILHINPMSYRAYAEYNGIDIADRNAFLKFSITGGVPKYWEYINPRQDVVRMVDELFFGEFSFLENEPYRLLKDENINGVQPLSILESIGRGAVKPSEIAGKLSIPQTSLGRPIQVLLDASIIAREQPFGESVRNSKKVNYVISDYALRFWYNVYSPHRSRWHLYADDVKKKLIIGHASFVLEHEYRKLFKDASRYWEGGDIEIDCVRYQEESLEKIILSEIKWGRLTKKERESIAMNVQEKFRKSSLARKYKDAAFEVLSFDDICKLF